MRKTRSSGGIVLNEKGEVLIVNNVRANGYLSWGFPKGHVQGNEATLTTAKREIYEESGVSELELILDLGEYERPSGHDPTEIKDISMFLFKTTQMALKSHDVQNKKAKWVKKSDVPKVLTHEADKKFFLKCKAKLK